MPAYDDGLAAVGYTGRFAPSPTGPLHLGSLYTALASYLDARYHHGRWLLRIDDLDTPRNQPGASARIMESLLAFGLQWDGEIAYQSQHLAAYQQALNSLQYQDKLYACTCSRKDLESYPGVYPGFCRTKQLPINTHYALRIKSSPQSLGFVDYLQGQIRDKLDSDHGDFIIRRKDGIIAYQLAVVIDDELQQVTHVVRGYDLLDSTVKQIFLQHQLGYATPQYRHVPVLVDRHGQKLSKQTLAQPVEHKSPGRVLWRLLGLLNQAPPANLQGADVDQILAWAVAHWQPLRLKTISSVLPN
ncbi:tRNA glutamyl-Q(34) synthetase GluQRS [Methylomonas paludis]|uniref:Glutamyl-Q tRNA(Asp) synthetase n=1 Tax=Methylomonas paludis TaxID=1173101 RepID=A0A975MLD7_9GAMM|nr:tRNA glutamyl-Q(34) synthetase GluQRS [Methylomonas paludis]QWF69942.1 tRNA glutamyl-Q(34) synthetase GluQRS [Methylomonas paludis]